MQWYKRDTCYLVRNEIVFVDKSLGFEKNEGKTHMKILIGADLVLTDSNVDLFSAGNDAN